MKLAPTGSLAVGKFALQVRFPPTPVQVEALESLLAEAGVDPATALAQVAQELSVLPELSGLMCLMLSAGAAQVMAGWSFDEPEPED